jgi:hypothetical protein
MPLHSLAIVLVVARVMHYLAMVIAPAASVSRSTRRLLQCGSWKNRPWHRCRGAPDPV